LVSKRSGKTSKNKEKDDKNNEYPDTIIVYSPFPLPIGSRVHIVTLEEEAKVIEKILEDFPKKGQKPLTKEERRKIARQAVGLEPPKKTPQLTREQLLEEAKQAIEG